LQAAYETVLHGTQRRPQQHQQPRQPQPKTTPAQLPRESAGFVGRGAELEALDDASGLALVVGPAGVGKTALALRWAHHRASAFPDGQLFADLRGFSAGAPVSAASVLAGFLRALDPGDHTDRTDRAIPADLDERVALYRSLLADRRVLVVLDNVRTVGDVLPLLPSGPGCATVVTTRNLLGGLVAREGAAVLRVEALPARESRALLARTVGRDRIAAETEAAAELVRLCEGLPLALRVAGARLAMRPGWTVSELVADLSDEQARLSVLTTDDADSGVEAALSLSYRVLPERAAALFRFLGLHQGTEADAWTAAALSGQSLAEAGRALADLASAHLLQETSTGRFARHDLVRLYTVRLAERDLTAGERAAAHDRLLDYYLAATAAAAEPVVSGRQHLYWPGVRPAAGIPAVADDSGWFRTEVPAIQALISACAGGPAAGRAWRLASNTMPMYFRAEHVDDWVTAGLAGLRAAESSGEAAGRARLSTDVGMALCERGDFAEAMPYLHRAVALAEESGSAEMRYLAVSRLAIGRVETGGALLEPAIDTLKEALALARDLGDLPSQASVLNNLGHVLNLLHRPAEALEFGHEARRLTAGMPSSHTHLASLATTAEALHSLGRHAEAIDCAREAVELSRRYGNPAYEALALRLIGQFQRDLGQDAESAESLRQSLGVFAPLGDRTGADTAAALLDEGEVRPGTVGGRDARPRELPEHTLPHPTNAPPTPH
jgi:tetratricopeptide (TPR) repeat protein